MNDTPRIYVADLAAYNAAYLHGIWVDATDKLDDIQDAINRMLEQSPVHDAEEFAIHGFEGFGGFPVSEHMSLEHVHEVACFIEEHGKLGAALLDNFCETEEAKKALEEDYSGCYQSLADFAQELTEETTAIPQNLQYYIDYERMGRELEMSGDVYSIETADDEVHVFWSR